MDLDRQGALALFLVGLWCTVLAVREAERDARDQRPVSSALAMVLALAASVISLVGLYRLR